MPTLISRGAVIFFGHCFLGFHLPQILWMKQGLSIPGLPGDSVFWIQPKCHSNLIILRFTFSDQSFSSYIKICDTFWTNSCVWCEISSKTICCRRYLSVADHFFKKGFFFPYSTVLVKPFTTDWDLNPCAGTWIQPKPSLGLELTWLGLEPSQNSAWDLNPCGWNSKSAKTLFGTQTHIAGTQFSSVTQLCRLFVTP